MDNHKKQLVTFWKKFATMIASGVPLVATLVTLRDENASTPLGSALIEVVERVKGGTVFSECLSDFPHFFGPDILQMLRGGERQGKLDEVSQLIGPQLEEGILQGPEDLPEAAPSTVESDEAKEKQDAVELLNVLLNRAIEEGASDIHFEPICLEGGTVAGRIRFRVDGVLDFREQVDRDTLRSMVTRLKVMANLDVAERQLPQDGRALVKLKVSDEEYDFRICVGPTIFGESGCLRILRVGTRMDVIGRQELIFPEEELREQLFEAARSPYGLIVVAGPTGCGKTTTVYSLLARQDATKCKVMTIEDPVELRLEGVHQVQVKPRVGLTYAPALRSFLRMDPDVIFCSEIRDVETADVLLRVALTGHLVFTQLHATDALSALQRLLDIGMEPYLVGDCLIGVVGQRLIRRLCPDCRRQSEEQREGLAKYGGSLVPSGTRAFEPVGCDNCFGTGYRGRRAIYEYLPMSTELRRVLHERPSTAELERVVLREGFKTMFENALPAIDAGETCLTEVLRVVGMNTVAARSLHR